ncbi:fimbrial protein [Atlantibacter subterranea]|uniref:fimbrial protein n=1 Tax=Atlantibacter subterraneus TaxID=255519 RepID=UPI0020C5691E|nr:fimbrial protein [Atlantibacter subterranea]UTJ47157.1 fimbrial protein [Atlantibacter subterranea]
MKTKLLPSLILAALAFAPATFVRAAECAAQNKDSPVNLTIPLTAQFQTNIITSPPGSVLWHKEATLSQLANSHREINIDCLLQAGAQFSGKLKNNQQGQNTYATSIPGIGIRVKLIYAAPGAARREWMLPFNVSVASLNSKNINTDTLSLRIELIKTGEFGTASSAPYMMPAMLTLGNNALVVNLAVAIAPPHAHCNLKLNSPQIVMPPIDAGMLRQNVHSALTPINAELQCINASQVALTLEGATSPTRGVFENLVKTNGAGGVGMQIIYGQEVMLPNSPKIILDSPGAPQRMQLPLSARYAKTGDPITAGSVQAKITLKINYL